MTVFDEQYARYYDLLYADKDYCAEADYVATLIRKQLPKAEHLLELGCGTGKHAELLANAGFRVHGVDRSKTMIQLAVDRAAALMSFDHGMSFSSGDVTSFTSENKYDAVISLFHVVSYQASNQDLRSMFRVAVNHLHEGGLFVFDVWYGPAVLSQLPEVRIKRLEDVKYRIIRIAEPQMDFNRNTVQVNYSMLCTDKQSATSSEFQESHLMRYLFQPEIELLLSEAGMHLASAEEWLSRKAPSNRTWSVCFVAVKDKIPS